MMADKASTLMLLKTARGQIEGIMKMVEDNRYCVDISNQLMATSSILCKINKQVLKAHIKGCVKTCILSGDPDEKLDEIMAIIDKLG
ncbi:MAG: metal-sensing transcriptional repressor [Lachnospiraceae bacterium]|nr:metal-sensing transcriptional repressor [Lachnospiraceae bacterium]